MGMSMEHVGVTRSAGYRAALCWWQQRVAQTRTLSSGSQLHARAPG